MFFENLHFQRENVECQTFTSMYMCVSSFNWVVIFWRDNVFSHVTMKLIVCIKHDFPNCHRTLCAMIQIRNTIKSFFIFKDQLRFSNFKGVLKCRVWGFPDVINRIKMEIKINSIVSHHDWEKSIMTMHFKIWKCMCVFIVHWEKLIKIYKPKFFGTK
jgi:hypothetical protein